MTALEELFAADIVSYLDGGGVVRAARIPIFGRARVAKFITAIASHFWLNANLEGAQAIGQAAVIISRKDVVIAIVIIDASPEGIDQILWLMIRTSSELLPDTSRKSVAQSRRGTPARNGMSELLTYR